MGAGIRRDRAPSSRLRNTYLSNECCSHCERVIGHRQRQCRQTPGRGPEHDLRALPGIEFRVVTRTFENAVVALFCFHPLRARTSGVGANQHKHARIVPSPAKFIAACDDPPRGWHGDPPAAPRHMLRPQADACDVRSATPELTLGALECSGAVARTPSYENALERSPRRVNRLGIPKSVVS